MIREIINIDEEKCNGCGLCIPNCPEGALQVIDGKARLVSDLFCDGLGACIGHCPEGAIEVEKREVAKASLEMLEQDLRGEQQAIDGYKERIAQAESLREYGLRRVLEDILIQEEEHKRDLMTVIND